MRKKEFVTVPRWGGRDDGKIFLITEWPAATAEKWAIRAVLAYNRGGVDELPFNAMVGMGMEAIFALGVQTFLRGKIDADEVIPVLDQLLECVKVVRDPARQDVVTDLLPDEPEEVKTRMWLRSEVLRIHTGFSAADALSSLISAIMASAPQDSPSASTSHC